MAFTSNKFNKFTATGASAALVATALVPAASADEATTAAFTDVAPQYAEAVEYLVSNNYAKGFTDTQFGIDAQIKRGDAAIMIAQASGLMDEDAPVSGFTDVPTRGQLAVNSLKAAGVVNGKSATQFDFHSSITRGEAALMLARAYELTGDEDDLVFTDVIGTQYDDAVAALVENGVTEGTSDTQYGTYNQIKRGDFARFLYELADEDEEVEDTEAPVLGYEGSTSLEIGIGEALDWPEIDAADNFDEEVDVNLVITDEDGNEIDADDFDAETAGTYTFTYTAVDAAGNEAEPVYVTVIVGEEDTSIISSVSEITTTGVTVVLGEDVEAMEDVTIEVMNPDGEMVAVEAENIEDDTETVTFEFVDELDEIAIGTWMVDGVEFDTGVPAAIAAVNAAMNQLELAAALDSDYFTDVEEDLIAFYFEEIEDVDFESTEDIQEVIDNINENTDRAEREAAAVEAVNDAINQVQLGAALENALFERYNEEWIEEYEAALDADDADTDSVEEIQAILDAVNDDEVREIYGAALEGLDADDIAAARVLIETYIVADDEDSEFTPRQNLLDVLAVQSALVSINEADTNAELTAAFDELEGTEADFNIETINEAEMSAYREALSGQEFATLVDVIIAVTTVNATAETNAAVAFNDITEDTTTAQLNDLIDVLADRSSFVSEEFVLDTVDDDFLEEYLEAFVDRDADITSAEDVMEVIEEVNDPAAELAVVAEADADDLYEALSVVQFNFSNLMEENEKAYEADIEAFNYFADDANDGSVADLRNLITAVNAKEAVENAETATEVRDALVQGSLASIELGFEEVGSESYINLGSQGRLEVAALILADDEEYGTAQDLQGAVVAAIEERMALIAEVNEADSITEIAAALEALGNSSYDAMDNEEQLVAAQNVLERMLEDGDYESITDIVAAF